MILRLKYIGESEHQTGLAFDINSTNDNFKIQMKESG